MWGASLAGLRRRSAATLSLERSCRGVASPSRWEGAVSLSRFVQLPLISQRLRAFCTRLQVCSDIRKKRIRYEKMGSKYTFARRTLPGIPCRSCIDINDPIRRSNFSTAASKTSVTSTDLPNNTPKYTYVSVYLSALQCGGARCVNKTGAADVDITFVFAWLVITRLTFDQASTKRRAGTMSTGSRAPTATSSANAAGST